MICAGGADGRAPFQYWAAAYWPRILHGDNVSQRSVVRKVRLPLDGNMQPACTGVAVLADPGLFPEQPPDQTPQGTRVRPLRVVPFSGTKGSTMRIRFFAAVFGFLLVACGTPTGPTEGGDDVFIVVPEADGSLPGDVWVACPFRPPFPASALDRVTPVLDTDPPGLREVMEEFLSDEEGQSWPQEGWQVLHRIDSAVLLVHHDAESDLISFMELEFKDGTWRWAGASSGCPGPLQIVPPEGLGVVSWRLDPEAAPLTPETTSIPLLVTELACVSGQPIGDRLVGPEVLMTEQEVLIAFGARPLPGGGDCRDNPEQPVMVQLPEPLGDRVVRDGMDTGLDLADFLD